MLTAPADQIFEVDKMIAVKNFGTPGTRLTKNNKLEHCDFETSCFLNLNLLNR